MIIRILVAKIIGHWFLGFIWDLVLDICNLVVFVIVVNIGTN